LPDTYLVSGAGELGLDEPDLRDAAPEVFLLEGCSSFSESAILNIPL
jgi:hypothetical protein